MSQFEGEVDENARIAIPSLEKRKEDAKEDLNNNYRGISHEQLKMAHDLFDNEGDTILKGYKKIWGLDDRWKRDPTLNEYAKKGYIERAPRASLTVKSKSGKKIEVSNYGFSKKSSPGGMIDADDLVSAGHQIDANGSYDWTAIKDQISEEIISKALKLGALREFTEETGLEIPSKYFERMEQNNFFTLELEDDEYEELIQPLLRKTGKRPQPEVSAIHFKKYLKYKNKYLQLKKQLK
jgi:hypothetical protein